MAKAATLLGARTWDFPDVGKITVRAVSNSHLDYIDSSWPSQRPATDQTSAWVWRDIVAGHLEAFVLVRVDAPDVPLAIWCSTARKPLKLPRLKCYRLDYIEISPVLRGGVFYYFALCIVAVRALEIGAVAVALQAFPALVPIYEAKGAVSGPITGWNHSPELVPCLFGS